MTWYLNFKLDLNLSCTKVRYDDLVYKLKKIVGTNIFSAQFIKIFPIIKRLAVT